MDVIVIFILDGVPVFVLRHHIDERALVAQLREAAHDVLIMINTDIHDGVSKDPLHGVILRQEITQRHTGLLPPACYVCVEYYRHLYDHGTGALPQRRCTGAGTMAINKELNEVAIVTSPTWQTHSNSLSSQPISRLSHVSSDMFECFWINDIRIASVSSLGDFRLS